MKPYYDEDGVTIYHGDATALFAALEQYCQVAVARMAQRILPFWEVAGGEP